MRRWLRSSTFGFVVLVFLLQLASAAAILLTVRQMTAGEALRVARVHATHLAATLPDRHDITALADSITARLRADPGTDMVILLTDRAGRVRAGNLAAVPAGLPNDGRAHVLDVERTGARRGPERVVVGAREMPDGGRLVVGEVIEDDLAPAIIVEDAMLGAALLAVPLALLGAVVAARVVNARVARIAGTVQAVAAGDLTQRVPLAGANDAFETLARGVNAMLQRIETLVGELRLVTDGLAHDLRSPLTRLRATLDRATASTDDPVASAALDTVAVEADGLLRMLTTALEISRAEAGIGRAARSDTDVAALIEDLAELYGPLAEEQAQRLEWRATPGLHHRLHRELVGQALANLIDNALKYGRAGGVVTLSAAAAAEGGLELAVADAGAGIAPEDRAAALRRFGRLDPARQQEGAGLGLSLVAAVAGLHEGTMDLEDNRPGLRVVLHLP
ncbi:ATP-binding protein [Sphingomonas arantia]|uniref:histidine kinase n=1 Tax=Sphingomonas arantia TaxID=1460676 RepID=A0ABW4TWP4_9SPHN